MIIISSRQIDVFNPRIQSQFYLPRSVFLNPLAGIDGTRHPSVLIDLIILLLGCPKDLYGCPRSSWRYSPRHIILVDNRFCYKVNNTNLFINQTIIILNIYVELNAALFLMLVINQVVVVD